MNRKHLIILLLIISIAAIFRFTGINWDDNAHLHPDERFLTMVATDITWPANPAQYFDTHTSPLNPHNRGFSFFVYGTYPLYLTKAVAQLVHKDTYDGIAIVGRTLSGIADLLTLITVFLITRYLTRFGNTKFSISSSLLAAFCYAIAVLPIQLSHFFTVDPYVTLFVSIALWRIIRGKFGLILGITTALAVGAKISALLIAPPIVAAYLFAWPWTGRSAAKTNMRRVLVRSIGLFLAGFILTLRVVYPYLFDGLRFNAHSIENWQQLKTFDSVNTAFPPALQWIGVSPLQPVWDLFVWGLGFPLGIGVLGSIFYFVAQIVHAAKYQRVTWFQNQRGIMLLLFWVFFVFIYQGIQFPKPMRYLWLIYPALAVLSGIAFAHVIHNITIRFRHICIRLPARRRLCAGGFVYLFMSVPLLIYPLSYLHIYLTPNTRVSATDWIYTHIPKGATIAWESWDDPLPFAHNLFIPNVYKTPMLPVFDPDSPEKWKKVTDILYHADYIILSSNRGYGAIGRAIDKFPETYRYYQRLFDGSLGFIQVAQFISRPTLPIPGIRWCITLPGFSYGIMSHHLTQCSQQGVSFIDDYADETYTVYDHPKVIILKKMHAISNSEILNK